MRDKQVMVRLSEAEVAALGVLTGGASREEWIRAQIRGAVTRRLMINEAAITQFNQMAGEAVRCAEDAVLCGQAEEVLRARKEAAHYRNEIAKYEGEKAILYGAMEGV